MKELIEELRACANGQPLDIYAPIITSAAEALESQAREIERLTQDRDSQQRACIRAMEELAALKAKPSGVVLLAEIADRYADRISSFALCEPPTEIVMEALLEVASLNQPASAGDERPAFEAACIARGLSLRPDGRVAGSYLKEIQCAWMLWQARAALSANHSEQVREGWQLVPVEPTPEMLASVTNSEHEALRAGVMRMAAADYRAMLAAAPSAGSQGGDV